jgi:hypothetical protein
VIDKSWRGCWKEIQGDGAAFAAAMVGNGWGWIEGVRYHPIGEAHRPRRKNDFPPESSQARRRDGQGGRGNKRAADRREGGAEREGGWIGA